ncbi:hypothetical protein ACIHCX_25295 [Streptomyces sp. NPDC052043]|uniref:hypothetical protein n=1 Tax=Streptomyces sp. NPDC052043 TaxID=3365684 RepID=UPI0037D64E78
MSLRRHLKRLLRETERDSRDAVPVDIDLSYTTEVPWPSLRKFAQFAYLAEQYGYRYDGLDPDLRESGTPFFVFRRLPDEPERAARMRERFPDATEGGRLPGMRSWPVPVLTLPEARREVRLLHARIAVDYYGAIRRQPLRPVLIGIPLVVLLALLVNGELYAAGLRVGAGTVAALLLVLGASRIFMRRRIAAYRRLLSE